MSLLWLARAALRRPGLFLSALTAVTLAAVAASSRLAVRTDGEALYAAGSPLVARTAADRLAFGQPEEVILLLTSRPGGPPVESPAGFQYLASVHAAVAKLPGVRPDGVRSLADLLEPPHGRNWLYVRAFLERAPETAAGFAELARAVHRHPLADGLFLSRDGRAAALYVAAAPGYGRRELVAQLEAWVAPRRHGSFDLRLTGPAVAEAELGETVLYDLARLLPLMVAVIALLLFLSLRTVAGVVIPLSGVLVVLAWTLGAMALFRVPVTLVTTVLPVVLLAATVTDQIQAMARIQARLAPALPELPALAGDPPRLAAEARSRAVLEALGEVQLPIVLTSVATALGFLSFLAVTVEPMRQFGIWNACGMLLEMVLTFLLVPALASVVPAAWFRRRSARAQIAGGAADRWLAAHGGAACALALVATSLWLPGLLRLTVQDSWVDNFDPRSPLVTAERDYNAHFWGSYRYDVVLEAKEDGFFLQPGGLALAESVTRMALAAPGVRGVLSYLVPYQILARGWGDEGPVSALPPAELRRVDGWVHVIRNRIDLEQYLTPDRRAARLSLLVNRADYRAGRRLRDHLVETLPALTRGLPVSFHTSGDLPLATEAVGSLVAGQLRSLGWTLAGIAALLVLAFRSLPRALAVLAPVAATAVVLFGAMGYAGLPLGIATSMFAALAVGVGVTFGIYLFHEYSRRRDRGDDHPAAVSATLAVTGRAIRWNALVLASGFLVLVFSALKPNRSLGLLLASSMVICYGTTLLLLPFLSGLVAGAFRGRRRLWTLDPQDPELYI